MSWVQDLEVMDDLVMLQCSCNLCATIHYILDMPRLPGWISPLWSTGNSPMPLAVLPVLWIVRS